MTNSNETIGQAVPEFFSIEAGTENGLDLDGSSKEYDVEKCEATRGEVTEALAWVARNRPELRDTMRVAIAMLVRLDTIRDDAASPAFLAQRKAEQGDAPGALVSVGNVLQILGAQNQRHALYVQ